MALVTIWISSLRSIRSAGTDQPCVAVTLIPAFDVAIYAALAESSQNKQVRVLRISYGPHEKSVMHGHPAGAVVFLTDGDFRFTYPDGKTENIRAKAGEVKWFEAFQHLPENLSEKPFEAVFVELKK